MTVSFKTEILPLFTSMDIEHMSHVGVSLDDYAYMSQPANASSVYERVSTGTMPPSDSGEQPLVAGPGPAVQRVDGRRLPTIAVAGQPI